MKAARVAAVIMVVLVLAIVAWTWIGGKGTTSAQGPPEPENPSAGEDPSDAGTLPRAMVTVVPTLDDRITAEPCNITGVGGLYSVTALLDEMRGYAPTVGVLMGNVTTARGGVGEDHVKAVCGLLLPYAHAQIMCPGEGELGPGSAFVRQHLIPASAEALQIIASNVTDGAGNRLFKGYEIAQAKAAEPADPTPRHILFVSVLADGMQKRLDARGSDITLLPARESVANTIQEALAASQETGLRIHNRVLLVQGTVAEAAELIDPAWEFDFAIASRGKTLPDLAADTSSGTPVYYGGRGARFAWRMILGAASPDSVEGFLVRLGQSLLARGSPLDEGWPPARDQLLASEVARTVDEKRRFADPRGKYVGSTSCDACHPDIAAEHDASRHAVPRHDIPAFHGCAKCHATGFDAEGGWAKGRDGKRVPAQVDCEACHGPAEKHLEDPKRPYGAFDLGRCTVCHLPDHSPGFDPEALWKEFGHRLGRDE